MSQGDSRDRRAGLTTDRLTDVNGNATETFNGAPSASVPTSGIPLLKRAPPHMRRLGGALQVSSPSDNPSPCSQKLMAADLQKGYPFSRMRKAGSTSLIPIHPDVGPNRVHSRVSSLVAFMDFIASHNYPLRTREMGQ